MNTTTSASTDSGSRTPAPGALALVQDFINTRDIEGGTDALATPALLAVWLSARGLLEDAPRLTDIDLGRALALRETLRQLLAAHHNGVIDEEALARFNALTASAGLMVRLDADGEAALRPVCTGMDGAIARLIAIVYDAIAAGTWQRLKVCRRDACRWAFYDASKNRSGTWCSMSVCGNRAKVHAYQQRRRSAFSC
jgi:predicted RNA-binding Zn ribbon-like protein